LRVPSRSTFFFSRRNARSTGSPFFNLISVNATHFLSGARMSAYRRARKWARSIVCPRHCQCAKAGATFRSGCRRTWGNGANGNCSGFQYVRYLPRLRLLLTAAKLFCPHEQKRRPETRRGPGIEQTDSEPDQLQGGGHNEAEVADIIENALKLLTDVQDTGDVRVIQTALREMRYASGSLRRMRASARSRSSVRPERKPIRRNINRPWTSGARSRRPASWSSPAPARASCRPGMKGPDPKKVLA